MLITNFASGELSPVLSGRVDLQQYYQAASRLSNFEIIPTGGIRRRTGTKRLGTLPGDSWLIPFNIDKDLSFLFVCHGTVTYTEADPQPTSETFSSGTWYISDGAGGYEDATAYDDTETYYVRTDGTAADVWRNGERATSSGNPVVLPLPYLSVSEVKEVQYAQYYDTMILTHGGYAPFRIRYDASQQAFSVATMTFDFAPDVRIDDDYGYVIIAENSLPAVTVTGGIPSVGGKSYDPDALFCVYSGFVYKYAVLTATTGEWRHYGEQPAAEENLFQAAGKYPRCIAFFNNRLYFASTYNSPQKVWASCAPDTAGERYAKFSTYETYVTVNKVIKDSDVHIFTGTATAGSRTITGVSQDFTSALSRSATDYYVTADCFPVGTKVVSVTSNTITVDRDPLAAAEGLVMNLSLWKNSLSPTADDYTYQVVSRSIVTASCSFNFEIASEESDAIKWLANSRVLAIGTETSVWCCSPAITAVSVQAEMSCRYGSDTIQALTADTAVVFFSQGGYGIREFYYDPGSEAFRTNNIAILSDRMLSESPAVDFDIAQNPYNRLLIVRQDGACVSLLYDKTNGILGWSRIEHGYGAFRSCAVTRGNRQNDIIYFAVKDGDSYFLESLDSNDGVYLDSFEPYDAAEPGAVSGRLLWNATTGASCAADNVPAGFINDGDVVYKGYPFESLVRSLPVVRDDPASLRRITELAVRFLESALPEMTVTECPPELFVNYQAPYTGVARVQFPGQYNRDVIFELMTQSLEPCVILGVNAKLN